MNKAKKAKKQAEYSAPEGLRVSISLPAPEGNPSIAAFYSRVEARCRRFCCERLRAVLGENVSDYRIRSRCKNESDALYVTLQISVYAERGRDLIYLCEQTHVWQGEMLSKTDIAMHKNKTNCKKINNARKSGEKVLKF